MQLSLTSLLITTSTLITLSLTQNLSLTLVRNTARDTDTTRIRPNEVLYPLPITVTFSPQTPAWVYDHAGRWASHEGAIIDEKSFFGLPPNGQRPHGFTARLNHDAIYMIINIAGVENLSFSRDGKEIDYLQMDGCRS